MSCQRSRDSVIGSPAPAPVPATATHDSGEHHGDPAPVSVLARHRRRRGCSSCHRPRAIQSAHQTLGNLLAIPFGPRQDLFQPVKRLEAGQRRDFRPAWSRTTQPRTVSIECRSAFVPAPMPTTRVGRTSLGDAYPRGPRPRVTMSFAVPQRAATQSLRNSDSIQRDPAPAVANVGTGRQACEMPVEKARPAVANRNGFEHTVTIGESPVGDRQLRIGRPLTSQSLPSDSVLIVSSASSMPLALARVSSSSRCGSESATMPLPAARRIFPAAADDSANQNIRVAAAVMIQVTHRTRIETARPLFQFRNHLHAADFRTSGDRAARKNCAQSPRPVLSPDRNRRIHWKQCDAHAHSSPPP